MKAEHLTNDELTHVLNAASTGDRHAAEQLIPVVYNDLRRLAAYRISQEQPGQTLQATALVHEAYLRVTQNPDLHWENKRYFFAAAAEAMRRILIENARRKKCKKRGGEWFRTEMTLSNVASNDPSDEILEVHEVLDQFAEEDPEAAELVKLRYFAGLTQQQCADILGISKRTADNRWAFARAWLFRAIHGDE